MSGAGARVARTPTPTLPLSGGGGAPHPGLRIAVNGVTQSVAAATLGDLVVALGLGDAKVAAAVNGAFVPRARWDRPLALGDAVDLVAPMQGG